MTDEVRRTLFHAALGSAVGTAAAMGSQELSNMINAQLSSAMGPRGPVFQGVVAGSMAALTILAGEKVINMITVLDDPLFRIFYYQTAFHGSSASWGFMRAVRSILNQGLSASAGPKYAPGPILSKEPQKNEAGCGGVSCGNLRM